MAPTRQFAQHHSKMTVEVNSETKIFTIQQELTYFNESKDTISSIVLNDWNNAYSSEETPLAKRFSDEFSKAFHSAKKEDFGHTTNLTVIDENKMFLNWIRIPYSPDLLTISLRNKIAPNQKFKINLTYLIKIPNDKFTGYGYNKNGDFNLKNWCLNPARYENGKFAYYNDKNLDDIANAVCDHDITIKAPADFYVTSNLETVNQTTVNDQQFIHLFGKNRLNFDLYLMKNQNFNVYKIDELEVHNGIQDKKLNDIYKAIIIDKVVRFVNENIGNYPYQKICVSQNDYNRNPFYGLNQLPSFISPFPDDFIFEIKFMKTYLNNFLKNTLTIDGRKDNWIIDAIQVYAMMKYIDEFHPEMKMLGNLSNQKLFSNFSITHLNFNEQYNYLYMFMARKNLDQKLGAPKDALIKFNEQIASKYRAGLSLKFLENYLNNKTVSESIKEFYGFNKIRQTNRNDFEKILKSKTNKNLDWFFKTIIDSRALVDYKFKSLSKTKDSITFTLKNKTGANVPIPVYGLNGGQIVFKKWFENVKQDSLITIPRNDINKVVINYKNEVPEYNLRNNWRSFSSFFPNNRPYKFVFYKDIEDPYYNQVIYLPTLTYNFYDGLSPGIRLNNKTLLDKPLNYDFNPIYSFKTNSLIGSFSFVFNQNRRDSDLYNIKYAISGSTFHYEPDASYYKLNPSITFRFRPDDFRNNKKEMIYLREVLVDRQKSMYGNSNDYQNYNVFNAKYINSKTEIIHHFSFVGDLQTADQFGKMSAEMEFRKLYKNNHQLNLRFFGGLFLYNRTGATDFYSFGLDRPSDYLFDYNFYGRSETTGFFSQQFINAEGGFKSKLNTPFANQWITTVNGSFGLWRWLETYADLGLVKNLHKPEKFVYDSGIRFNFLTNYLELYFPVYSNNGWEISQSQYIQKVRFVIILDPKVLTSLFSRRWL